MKSYRLSYVLTKPQAVLSIYFLLKTYYELLENRVDISQQS